MIMCGGGGHGVPGPIRRDDRHGSLWKFLGDVRHGTQCLHCPQAATGHRRDAAVAGEPACICQHSCRRRSGSRSCRSGRLPVLRGFDTCSPQTGISSGGIGGRAAHRLAVRKTTGLIFGRLRASLLLRVAGQYYAGEGGQQRVVTKVYAAGNTRKSCRRTPSRSARSADGRACRAVAPQSPGRTKTTVQPLPAGRSRSSVKRRYHRTHGMTTSRSKCRPLNKSSTPRNLAIAPPSKPPNDPHDVAARRLHRSLPMRWMPVQPAFARSAGNRTARVSTR